MTSLPADFYSRRLQSRPRDYRAFADFTARYMPRAGLPLIIDVGAGRGDVLNGIRGAVSPARAIALDADVQLLRAARAQFRVTVADFDAGLPFVDGCADALILSFVTHLSRDRAALFSECCRVLKRGGMTFILTASESDLRSRFMNEFFPSMYNIDIVRYGGLIRVRQELEDAGFTIAAVERLRLGEIAVDDAFIDGLANAPWSSLAVISEEERREGIARLRKYHEDCRREGGALRHTWLRTAVAAVKG